MQPWQQNVQQAQQNAQRSAENAQRAAMAAVDQSRRAAARSAGRPARRGPLWLVGLVFRLAVLAVIIAVGVVAARNMGFLG
jgi:hypothetical protein